MTDAFSNTPLLGGETRKGGRKPFIRRWDAFAYGSPYQKAAALLDLAADGRGLPEGAFDVPNYEASVKFYFIFIRFDIIWTLNCFALIALHFFEQPLWCSSISEVSCSNRDYFYLGELPYLTSAESLAFKGVTLVILVVHTLFPILFEGGYFYWRNHVNKLKVISLLILTVDLVVDILPLSPVTICTLPLRIAPYIRVLLFIWNIRGLRDNLIVLGGMVVTYVNVLALWLLFLVFSSWLAYVIFEDTQQGTTFFLSYSATLYQMFVLFTTSNNPDVWIPAYKSSRWSSLFFILYVLLGVYFVTNLVLAVIYDTFKLELLKQVVAKGDMRTRTLRMVFNLIDSRGAGYLDKDQCFKLLEELNNYRTLPKISKEDFELIFNTLDHIGNDKISAEEFNDIYDAIALGFQMEDTEPWLTKFVFYNSSTSETLKNFVKSTKFGNIVAFVLLLNLVTVIVETTLNVQNNSGQNFWQRVEFVFGWIYALEMALKVYTYGFENFWKDGQNQFDFIITLVIVMGETATFVSPKELTFISSGECIRYLLIARMLRLIRLLMRYQSYRTFVATFLTLIPSLMPYLGTVFWVMCIYCTLGIQIFGGIVNAGNPDLPATDLADNEYPTIYIIYQLLSSNVLLSEYDNIANCYKGRSYIAFCSVDLTIISYLLFNFNDYPNGMVTLFNLLVMGNWQVWMQDYATLTGTSWTYAYFISFYLITILLLLNLVVAFVLEAFFAELELEYPEEEGNQMGVRGRRNMSIRTRSQRVDMLLRQMLRSELNRPPPSSP